MNPSHINGGTVMWSFNTASGRYYCNETKDLVRKAFFGSWVSIPQAVGTIAMK